MKWKICYASYVETHEREMMVYKFHGWLSCTWKAYEVNFFSVEQMVLRRLLLLECRTELL